MRRGVPGFLVLSLLACACASSAARARGSDEVLRLGVFPNLTHAPALVGLEEGIFRRVLAPTRVQVTYFNSGSDAATAISSGSIDATYIGPGPSASLYLEGASVAVISGATAGGASLVVRNGAGISSPNDLHGKKVAVPGVGNTQDMALRTWLLEHGLKAKDEGGDVAVAAVDNTTLLQLFQNAQVDAAWEPEPWPSYLIAQGVAERFVDERTLWPGGMFETTDLLVNTIYMDAHPGIVRKLVEANVEAIQAIQDDPTRAEASAIAGLEKAGAPSLDQSVIDAAWGELTFTWDPIATSLRADAEHAYRLGFLQQDPGGIFGIYRLDDLNAILVQRGEQPIEVPT